MAGPSASAAGTTSHRLNLIPPRARHKRDNRDGFQKNPRPRWCATAGAGGRSFPRERKGQGEHCT
jgi:hypothetical protein